MLQYIRMMDCLSVLNWDWLVVSTPSGLNTDLQCEENNKPSHQTCRLLAVSLPQTSFPVGIWKLFNFLQIKHQNFQKRKIDIRLLCLLNILSKKSITLSFHLSVKVRRQEERKFSREYLMLNYSFIIDPRRKFGDFIDGESWIF